MQNISECNAEGRYIFFLFKIYQINCCKILQDLRRGINKVYFFSSRNAKLSFSNLQK